jgi:hypothetical protein
MCDDFEPVTEYFALEAVRFGLNLSRPIEIQLGDDLKEIQPVLPTNRIMLDTIIWRWRWRWRWRFRFRFFAWQNSQKVNVKPDIKLYLPHDNPNSYAILSHSTALNKGIIGFVKLYADAKYADKNIVILAHSN